MNLFYIISYINLIITIVNRKLPVKESWNKNSKSKSRWSNESRVIAIGKVSFTQFTNNMILQNFYNYK